MSSILSTVSDPIKKYIIAAVVAGVLAITVCGGVLLYTKGRDDGTALCEAAVLTEKTKWQSVVAEQQRTFDAKLAKIADGYKAKESTYKAEISKWQQTPTIKGYKAPVLSYISPKVDWYVPKGFVDLHNTAAAGIPTQDTIKLDADQQSLIKLSEAASTIAGNYYTCNDIRDKLIALQDSVILYATQQEELSK